MNAFTAVFQQFSLMNCFFHLCQSVQKLINKSFKVRYRTDKAFARASRLVAFSAFVPLSSIEDAFEALSVHVAGTFPELLAVVNYFENSYLGQATPEGPRTSPRFPVQFWNHHSTIMVDPDYPRTSNFVEGFHRGSTEPVLRFRSTSGLSGRSKSLQIFIKTVLQWGLPPPRNVVGVLTATCSLSTLVLRITPQLLSICSPLPSTSFLR